MSARTAVKQRVSQGQVNTPGERVHYRYIPLRDPLVCENGRRQRSRIIVTLFDNPEGIHSDAVSAPLERGLYISIRGLFTVGDAAYSLVDSNGRMLAEFHPVPMDTWESGRPAAAYRETILAMCGRILAEKDPLTTDLPGLLADYRGYFPYYGFTPPPVGVGLQ